ncbi:carboxymuconolactone decarboxylase family protein [Paenibacillus sp. HN-1]|uniref:carboxymuconolactone decarboxylase family protein n=1 Tax=Paenibacillus TaxID=44249 RepID=UPI001CA82ABF|nr:MULTISPECIES: carboxymuconolactone decarboxylase family protein [Paenibacillus]MBY9078554.1 carboxymuconolactone decarboxylase family protein [Paenibacillus sp. CGMCC 1.18879]MBY9082706.1 carboxymuconolactone decarboxylase family protein [Paenibacillus sinensis]
MSRQRYEQGWEKLMEIDGEGGQRVIESLKEIAPDLGSYVVEFAFGDIYSRGGLDLKSRQLITLASLLTQGGCEPQLTVHLNAALNVGLTPHEIVEGIMHCVPYTGFPRVLNAILTAKTVFQERGVIVSEVAAQE